MPNSAGQSTLTINGQTYALTVHQQQDFPFLIMLHGFMGSQQAFQHLIKPLSQFCNPVTIDLLGHGKSGKAGNAGRYSLEHQLDDLDKIICKLDLPRFFLHGYSMGGRLALRYALNSPNNLDGLILESTNYGIVDDEGREKRKQQDAERAKRIETDFETFLEEWQQLPLFKNGSPADPQLHKRYQAIQAGQSPRAMANSLLGFGTGTMPAVKDRLHELTVPTLLLAGQHDQKYRQILSTMHELIPRSSLQIIRNAGHRVHLDSPRAFIEKVKAFVLCASA